MWPLTSFGHALKARSRWFIGQTRHLALVLCAFVAAHAVHKGAREVVYKANVFWFGRGLRSVNWQEMGSLIIYSYLFPLLSLELPALLKVVDVLPYLTVRLKSHPPCGWPLKPLPGVEFHAVKGFAESLPFPAAQFDAVVGSLVMCGWAKFSEQNWRLCWYLLALCPAGLICTLLIGIMY